MQDTQPLEGHGGPDAVTVAGAIPDVAEPDEETCDYVFGRLWSSPPVHWDPRLQHKKQFRELVKLGGQVKVFFMAVAMIQLIITTYL
jgi:hypothetical protein